LYNRDSVRLFAGTKSENMKKIFFSLLIVPGLVFAQTIQKDRLIYVKDLNAYVDWLKIANTYNTQELTHLQQVPGTNIGVSDFVVNADSKPESEVYAAINPRDTNNIVVASVTVDLFNFNAPVNAQVYFSRNFGITWQKSNFDFTVDNFPAAGGGKPVMVFAADGTLHMSWITLNPTRMI
jgi:hypothetical protein